MRSLNEISVNETVKIHSFDKNFPRSALLRFAIYEGQTVQCLAKPGPILVKENHQIVAIGKDYAKKIYINDK